MTLDEALRVREAAAFTAPSLVDWAKVEQAVEVIARAQVAREEAQTRGTEPRGVRREYDAAAKRGGVAAPGRGGRVRRGRIVDREDYEARLADAAAFDEEPPGWAEP